jgi:hypothetical protein
MSEETTETPEEVTKTPANQDDDFVDKVLDQAMSKDMVAGITMRPPTLGTIAVLTRLGNSLVTGDNLTEDNLMMQCLIFMWVHTVDPDELHGTSLIADSGRNLAIERAALELGDKLPFTGVSAFEAVYTQLNEWINKHVESKVEPIPDKDAKPDSDPNV